MALEMKPTNSAHAQAEHCFDSMDEKVPTPFGDLTVTVVGDRKKPAMVTFHDIGQNANTCFQAFFQFSEMASIAERFCIYHFNAPGQEEDATTFAEDYAYPTLDDIAAAIRIALEKFGIKSFIGLGVGAGANILCRFALDHPHAVDALILVNCSVTQAGWIEWGYQKMNINYLWKRGMTNFTVDYLMWHHFGKDWRSSDNGDISSDLLREYYQFFCRWPQTRNLAMFIDAYISRTDLCLQRGVDSTLDCPVLQIVGTRSPHIEESVDTMSKLQPEKSDWLKMSDCGGLVLDEAPDRVTESIMLFLQGQGHLCNVSHTRWVERKRSLISADGSTGSGPDSPRLGIVDGSRPAVVSTLMEDSHARVTVT